MAAKETKVYPIRGHYLSGVPAAVHVVPSKADADALVASGAFTTNAHDAERADDAPDISADGPLTHESVVYFGEAPPGDDAASPQGPPEGGSSDSGEE